MFNSLSLISLVIGYRLHDHSGQLGYNEISVKNIDNKEEKGKYCRIIYNENL
jgi:hypothetical protein